MDDSKPLICQVKSICVFHEKKKKQNSKKFIIRLLSSVTFVNFEEQKAEAETRDKTQGLAHTRTEMSTE